MRYLGMDVAKAKLDCLLLNENGDKGKSKSVANSRTGIADFLIWIGKPNSRINTITQKMLDAKDGIYRVFHHLWWRQSP
jgi:hypothetical protein